MTKLRTLHCLHVIVRVASAASLQRTAATQVRFVHDMVMQSLASFYFMYRVEEGGQYRAYVMDSVNSGQAIIPIFPL